MNDMTSKAAVRKHLREVLAAMGEPERHQKSLAACSLVASSPEFAAARVVMLFLSTPAEIDTASLALKSWQAGKTVVVPKVSWDQRRMLPVEISSLNAGMAITGPGVREPINGKPIPVYRANRLMRGAAVGAGKHTLVFTYRPASFRYGLVLSSAGLATLGALALTFTATARDGAPR